MNTLCDVYSFLPSYLHCLHKDNGVVIMSLDEYNSLQATYLELSSKANEKRLDSAIEKLKTGSSYSKELIEP